MGQYKLNVVLVFIIPCVLLSQPVIENPDEPLPYPRALYPPEIDGEMDSIWYNAPRYPMHPEILNYSAPDDWYDMSGEWRAMWDENNIYYLVEVRDDEFVVGSDWNYDSFEIYFDSDYSHRETYDGEDDVQFRFHKDDETGGITVYTNDQGPEYDVSGFVWAQAETDLGWMLEVAFPVEDIMLDTYPGNVFGVEVQYNDNDSGTQTEHKLIAFGDDEQHWQNPSLFGAARMQEWKASDTLHVVKTKTTPRIDGDLDPVWQDVPVIPATEYISFDKVENFYDLCLTSRTMWDDDNLYYFITVWDDIFMRDGNGDYDDDGVELYSDGDFSGGDTYDMANDFQFAIRYDPDQLIQEIHLTGNSAGTPVDLSHLEYAAQEFDAGLTLEIVFPMNVLQITPQVGNVYGIEIDYNDDDDGGIRDTKLKTYSNDDNTWQYPRLMRPAKLVDYASVHVNTAGIEKNPVTFALGQNYPNPFNPSTRIPYEIFRSGSVELDIFDTTGRCVRTLVNEFKSGGVYCIEWDGTEKNGSNVSSGIYFCVFTAGGTGLMQKLILVR